MKKLLTLATLLICLSGYAQEGKYTPFKLIVLKPDTAIISSDFFSYRDSVKQTQIDRYLRTVKTYNDMANCKACNFEKEDVERYKKMVIELKKLEPEVRKFKYFDVISSYSAEVYNFYFNEYEPYSTIIEMPNQRTSIESLKSLAESGNVDYIVFFSQLHTAIKNNQPLLLLTTSLYSKKENKVVFSKETTGDLSSRGDMWSCTNPLACLFINGVRTSTNEVSDLLRKLQLKNINSRNE
jgi:hypothetical protein